VDGLWTTKSEDVGLIVRAISFQDFQYAMLIHQLYRRTERQTDGQTTCNLNTALCTIHRAAENVGHKFPR